MIGLEPTLPCGNWNLNPLNGLRMNPDTPEVVEKSSKHSLTETDGAETIGVQFGVQFPDSFFLLPSCATV